MTRAACVFIALAFAAPAWAQDDAICKKAEGLPKKQPLVVLGVLFTNGCLGRDRDADALTKRVGDELSRQLKTVKQPGVHHSAQEQKMVMLWTLDLVSDALRSAPPRAGSASGKVLESMRGKVDETRAAVLDALPQEKNPANAGYWQWNPATGRFPGVPAERQPDLAPLQAECADEASAACREAFETGKLALRLAALVERALTFQSRPILEEARLEAARRNRMWHAYFEEARVQLPLELVVNSSLYRRRAKDEGGFAEAPRYQVILLHPSAGLQYVRSAQAGSRFEPALLVEVAGINAWQWKQDGSMGTALGASLVATYSDRAGAKGAGGGVAIHVNHRYSVAFTAHGGRLGITVSTDLARFFTKADDEGRAQFRLGK